METINPNAINSDNIEHTINHYYNVLELVHIEIKTMSTCVVKQARITSMICTLKCHLCTSIITKLGYLNCDKCVHYSPESYKSKYCIYQDTYKDIKNARDSENMIELHKAIQNRIKYLEKLKEMYDNLNLK